MSSYYLEHASVDRLQKHFDYSLLALGLPIPAYDQLLKTSHTYNILDARGFIGVTERSNAQLGSPMYPTVVKDTLSLLDILLVLPWKILHPFITELLWKMWLKRF